MYRHRQRDEIFIRGRANPSGTRLTTCLLTEGACFTVCSRRRRVYAQAWPLHKKTHTIKSERVYRLEFKQYFDDDASFVRENIQGPVAVHSPVSSGL